MLETLLARGARRLGDQFAGLYLYGSLAAGDFDPPSGSDIDFVVATHGALNDATVAALAAMHADLAQARRSGLRSSKARTSP